MNQNERAELHKTIWKIANDLRGSVDGCSTRGLSLCVPILGPAQRMISRICSRSLGA